MRHVASYALEAHDPSDECFRLQVLAIDRAEQWLDSKGDRTDDGKALQFSDGRIADLRQSRSECESGQLTEISLEEPIDGGTFTTAIKIGGRPDECCISVALSAATATLAPQFTEIRTPRLIRAFLDLKADWRYQSTPIAACPVRLNGAAGGDSLHAMIWDPDRALPVITVSEDQGFVLIRDIASQLSVDLAALATVVTINEEASWRLTGLSGREWSCYGGAIRVYWPGAAKGQSPFKHQLWTPTKLLASALDVEDAAAKLRRQLRRTILAQSAFAISPPVILADIQHASRVGELNGLKQRVLAQANDVAAAYELFHHAAGLEAENRRLQMEVQELREANKQLQSEKRGLIAALASSPEAESDIDPETEAPPDSLQTAIEMAKSRFPDDLVLGEDAESGIADVRCESRGVEKVLQGLTALGELARELKRGPLGVDLLRWLNERGQKASGESDTTRNNPRLMAHRMWGNGLGRKQAFEYHLKPTSGTSPDKCIRIYFKHDETRGAIVVGWIGRHPPE